MDNKLKKFLQSRGYEANDSLSAHINTWKSWYKGKVEGFHNYTVWNGRQNVKRERASMQLGKTVCEQWANLLFNEKCKITIENEAVQKYIYDVFDKNNVYIKLNESQEKKAAFGTMCYIPYYTNAGIKITYVTAENMIPLSWENGVINELAVYSNVTSGGMKYIYVQLFVLEADGTYRIENLLFEAGKGKGESAEYIPVNDINAIKGFEQVEATIRTGSQTKPFIIDRLNICNNIDPDNPLGIAVFANAIDTMENADIIFDSYRNEFILGRKRVMTLIEAINIKEDGQPVFDPNDTVFYLMPQAGMNIADKPFVQELDMKLRAGEHQQAGQFMLDIFSSQCGLGEKFYKFNTLGSPITATQVISENNPLFRTLEKHKIILEAVIIDLIRLITEIAQQHNLISQSAEDAEIKVTFDDSVIEDRQTRLADMRQDVSAGIIKAELYIMEKYGKTEKEAAAMMPELSEVME